MRASPEDRPITLYKKRATGYANLFWLFGHPEVYILILPSFGVFNEVISVFSSKTLYGYISLVVATMIIAVLSFTVWLHHFFTMGQSGNVNAAFGVATMLIGIPTGVKIYDWILTMFRGRIRFNVSMLYSIAFIVLFAVGGMTGIMLANPGVDYQVHNTVFLVAHFHNVLIPGLLFGMLAGYHYWFPKAFGFRLSEVWGRIAFFLWTFGFLFAFMPLYALGLLGMPRRTVEYFQGAYLPYTLVAAFGALLVIFALGSLAAQLWVSVRDRETTRVPAGDPWNGRNLEWMTSAPPPEYNFAVLPQVGGREWFWARKVDGTAYRAPATYEDIEMPRGSAVGPILAASGAICGFGLVWHIWWLVALALATVVGTVIGRSFVRETTYVIPAAQVRQEHEDWLRIVVAQRPVTRDEETAPANHGLAEAMAV